MTHSHRWLMYGVPLPWRRKARATVSYRCACGADRIEVSRSPLVVGTARLIAAREVVGGGT